jgi:hypothetical protein
MLLFNSINLLYMARGGTVRWNRYITPDLCLATSWLHDLIYTCMDKIDLKTSESIKHWLEELFGRLFVPPIDRLNFPPIQM